MCVGRPREDIDRRLFILSLTAIGWSSTPGVLLWHSSKNATPHSKDAVEEGGGKCKGSEGLPMAGDAVTGAAEAATKANDGPCPQHKKCRQATHQPENG